MIDQVPFIKLALAVVLCHVSLTFFSQEVMKGRWTPEFGMSTNSTFKKSSIINLRYASPRFRVGNEDQDWTEEEEKQAEKFRNGRFMMELLYTPPLRMLGASFNLQYRIVKFKRLSLEPYGGLKFFVLTEPDFVINPYVSGKKEAWYINFGIICQVDLGLIAPFADISTDGIFTIGTGADLVSMYKKIRKQYRPPYMQTL